MGFRDEGCSNSPHFGPEPLVYSLAPQLPVRVQVPASLGLVMLLVVGAEEGAGRGLEPFSAPVNSTLTVPVLPSSMTAVTVHVAPTVACMSFGVHACVAQSKLPARAPPPASHEFLACFTLTSLTLAPLKVSFVQPRVPPEVMLSSPELPVLLEPKMEKKSGCFVARCSTLPDAGPEPFVNSYAPQLPVMAQVGTFFTAPFSVSSLWPTAAGAGGGAT